jgi:hypothetical protein
MLGLPPNLRVWAALPPLKSPLPLRVPYLEGTPGICQPRTRIEAQPTERLPLAAAVSLSIVLRASCLSSRSIGDDPGHRVHLHILQPR